MMPPKMKKYYFVVFICLFSFIWILTQTNHTVSNDSPPNSLLIGVRNSTSGTGSFKTVGQSNNSLVLVDSKMILKTVVKNREISNLIVNTYMRSGSTFIGSIFSVRKYTFVMYEPLWKALRFRFYSGPEHICHYSRTECARSSDNVELTLDAISLERSLFFLNSFMDCSFADTRYSDFFVDAKHFKSEFPDVKHDWSFYRYNSWDEYKACAALNGSKFQDCLKLMEPVCEKADLRVSKVIRTSLDNLEVLMTLNPTLKIVHSFRDPRGIINSRLNTGFYKPRISTLDLIKQDITTMCRRMKADFITAKKYLTLYPDRFMVIQYENLSNLTESAPLLYKFAGMPDDAVPDLNSLSSSSGRFGFHAYSYRWSLPWSLAQFTASECSSVIKDLGYPEFHSESEYNDKTVEVGEKTLTFDLSKLAR